MSSSPQTSWRHPVASGVERLHAELDGLADTPVWSMSEAECAETLTSLTRLRARVAELELRVAAEADRREVGQQRGATSTPLWWAFVTCQTRVQAQRAMRLAQSLDRPEHEPVRSALAAGEVQADQAQVILDAVDALPVDLPADLAEQATRHLIGLAAEYDAKALRVLGRRVLDVVAPEIAEAHEQRVLEREEADAGQRVWFTLRDDGQGTSHGRFRLPTLQAQLLETQLRALAAPKHRGRGQPDGMQDTEGQSPSGGRVSRPLRLGQAFAEYVETHATTKGPKAGGLPATVVVTMTLEQLESGLGAATLDTGGRISAGQARRLACEAGIIPAVLGGESQVLDVGRKRRFHTQAQRTALAIRDKGCMAVGCDWPPGMCHAHHNKPWSEGGSTSVEDGSLVCPRHHGYLHNPHYLVTVRPDGKLTFTRRAD